jgi:hypothetical protein
MRSKNDSYKRLCTDLGELGLRHRRGHDLRRTMISLTRTDGARKDLLELCTHTPRKQSTIDVYTEFPWESLCGEVAKLKIHREVRGEVVPLRRAVNGDISSGEEESDGQEPGKVAPDSSMILARLATPLATPSGNHEELRQVRQWRRRESNCKRGLFSSWRYCSAFRPNSSIPFTFPSFTLSTSVRVSSPESTRVLETLWKQGHCTYFGPEPALPSAVPAWSLCLSFCIAT